ncbi:PIN domain-containing protein [Kitasatospora sp. NBC_01266]|uniref:PIN domain-containing protein n=1 Tax=Kitasatospora sp. NBC_01266 TaxID=2903572 RepID=UPI002E324817|nr:PIN domain-containing protein [Kitasatospora sp. NBC_01266]
MSHVLDTSAVIALLRGEPGAAVVEGLLAGSRITQINLSEILRTADRLELPVLGAELASDLAALTGPFESAATVDAVRAAELITLSYTERPDGRTNGVLSYGDAWCIATAERLGLPVLTAERAWADLQGHLTTKIALIR